MESGVKYMRRNFLCGLQGREPASLTDINAELRQWVAQVANQRVHGTTDDRVSERWERERISLQPLNGRLAYPYAEDELRKVARDAYVEWQGSRYSVPWKYAGQQVWVRQQACEIQVRCGSERIAMHSQAVGQHQVVTRSEHHAGIPLSGQLRGKTLIHIQQSAPVVEVRSLAVYESACLAGVQ